MARVLLVLAHVSVVVGANYGFGECVSNQRTLYYYSPTPQTCESNSSLEISPPVYGLDCTVTCHRGYFLGADFTGPSPVSGCEKCPSGQYSIGGGKLYAAMTNAWQAPLPLAFDTQCSSKDINTGNWVENCAPWSPDITGNFLTSGNNSQLASNFNADRLYSTLRLTATYVRSGNITFQYLVDAEPPYDGLTFMIDGVIMMNLVSTTNGWAEMTYGVSRGSHIFVWKYTKNDVVDWGLDQAAIQLIELAGTSYSDTSCHTCGGEMSRLSRKQCRLCDENQYAGLNSQKTFTCLPCPFNTYSPPGSFSIDACIASRPCDVTDMAIFYTPCANNRRSMSRVWAQPMTCNASLSTSNLVPTSQSNVECGECTDGYYPDSTGVCQTCPDGQIVDTSGNYSFTLNSTNSENDTNSVLETKSDVITLCRPCKSGTIMLRSQLYGTITRRGWSLWPTIVDNVTAIRNGWKLTEYGISRDSSYTPAWISTATLLLNTTHINRGEIAINYTLANLPSPGSQDSAVLDLYVNDVAIKLDRGSSNGTFYQRMTVSPRLNGNQTLAVQFIWRTSSALVDRTATVLIRSIKLTGTISGGSAACDTCPTGYIPNQSKSTCTPCPAGTAAILDSTGKAVCSPCPSDTFAFPGSGICTPCGTNTYSQPRSTICRAKQLLIDGTTTLMYNLTAIQSMVDPLSDLEISSGFLPSTPLHSSLTYALDSKSAILLGIFRPIQPHVPSQYVIDPSTLTNSDTIVVASPQSYSVGLDASNVMEVGSSFMYNADRFGLVQCTIPPRFRVFNAGGKLDVITLSGTPGIRATHTLGSLCNSTTRVFYSTSIDFKCDPNSGPETKPVLVQRDACSIQLSWTTSAACPLCDLALFTPTKSACSLMGNQTVTYVPAVPCVGGSQPTKLVTVQTCASITLDNQTAGIAAGVVLLILVLIVGLIVGLVIVYRKYKSTMVEFLHLKGLVNSHELLESGDMESRPLPATTSPNSSVISADADEEEEIDIQPKASVVIYSSSLTPVDHLVNDELNLLWDEHPSTTQVAPPPLTYEHTSSSKPFSSFKEALEFESHSIDANQFPKESLEPMAFNPQTANQAIHQFPDLHPLDGSFLRSAFESMDSHPSTHTPRSLSLHMSDLDSPNAVDHLSPHAKIPSPKSKGSKQVICQVPNCSRRVRSKGMCKAHGGGRKCTLSGCNKSAQNGDFCIGHGGGKQCNHPGCGKAAQSHGLCKAHGGGARCKHPDCMKSSQGGGYCRAHGGGKRCQAENCTKGAQRGNFCATHGGFRNCQVGGCVRTDRGGGYCEVHRRDKLCTVNGCKKLSKNNGLCTLHLRNNEKETKSSLQNGYVLPHMTAISHLNSH